MKKALCILFAFIMLLSMVACGETSSATTSAPVEQTDTGASVTANAEPATADVNEAKTIKIGISLFARDFTVDICEAQLNKYAAEYEAETGIKTEFTYLFCDYNVAQQIADVEALITMGCDAIAVRVTDTEGCNVCFDSCVAAGIPCVAMWNGGSGSDIELHAVDNYIIGRRQAEWFIDYIKDSDTVYKCGYLDGISTAADTLLRCEGFCDVIKETYGDLTSGQIQVIDTQYSENNADTSQRISEDWLIRYPDMNCIIGWNDLAAYGATQTFITAGFQPDDYVIIGCDGTDYNDLLLDGTWEMTIGLNFKENCKQLWDVMINLATGNRAAADEAASTPPDTYFMITKDSLEEWNEIIAG